WQNDRRAAHGFPAERQSVGRPGRPDRRGSGRRSDQSSDPAARGALQVRPAPAHAPRKQAARIICGCVCSLVILVLSAQPGDARATAVPQSKQEQAKAWREIATLPDFWQGTWQSVSPIADDFPTPPDYTPSALNYIMSYKPVEDS